MELSVIVSLCSLVLLVGGIGYSINKWKRKMEKTLGGNATDRD